MALGSECKNCGHLKGNLMRQCPRCGVMDDGLQDVGQMANEALEALRDNRAVPYIVARDKTEPTARTSLENPEDASQRIVSQFLSDLSSDRQEAIRQAIEDAMAEWGNFTAATTYESSGDSY